MSILPVSCLDILNIVYSSILEAMHEITVMHIQVNDRFYIYLEYVHPGSINNYVREHCEAITESVVCNFTRHILSGLAYLHGKNTIHRYNSHLIWFVETSTWCCKLEFNTYVCEISIYLFSVALVLWLICLI